VNGIEAPFQAGWEAHRDRHCIWIVSPEGYEHQRAFDDLADSLEAAFAELGGSAPVVRHPADWSGRSPLVLGANLLSDIGSPRLPDGSIIFNLEQFALRSDWITPEYLFLLSDHPLLDYSRRNSHALSLAGLDHVQLLEIGYSPVLARVQPAATRDIDIFFYGSMNDRRRHILEQLAGRGFHVVAGYGSYGAERDELIGRSRIVLNLHAYETNIFEIVRVSYLLSNGVCVVSEGDPSDPDVQGLAGGLELVPYERLVDACTSLLNDEARRDALARAGFEKIRSRLQAQLLLDCIERSGR
jgi:hypothetical protein